MKKKKLIIKLAVAFIVTATMSFNSVSAMNFDKCEEYNKPGEGKLKEQQKNECCKNLKKENKEEQSSFDIFSKCETNLHTDNTLENKDELIKKEPEQDQLENKDELTKKKPEPNKRVRVGMHVIKRTSETFNPAIENDLESSEETCNQLTDDNGKFSNTFNKKNKLRLLDIGEQYVTIYKWVEKDKENEKNERKYKKPDFDNFVDNFVMEKEEKISKTFNPIIEKDDDYKLTRIENEKRILKIFNKIIENNFGLNNKENKFNFYYNEELDGNFEPEQCVNLDSIDKDNIEPIQKLECNSDFDSCKDDDKENIEFINNFMKELFDRILYNISYNNNLEDIKTILKDKEEIKEIFKQENKFKFILSNLHDLYYLHKAIDKGDIRKEDYVYVLENKNKIENILLNKEAIKDILDYSDELEDILSDKNLEIYTNKKTRIDIDKGIKDLQQSIFELRKNLSLSDLESSLKYYSDFKTILSLKDFLDLHPNLRKYQYVGLGNLKSFIEANSADDLTYGACECKMNIVRSIIKTLRNKIDKFIEKYKTKNLDYYKGNYYEYDFLIFKNSIIDSLEYCKKIINNICNIDGDEIYTTKTENKIISDLEDLNQLLNIIQKDIKDYKTNLKENKLKEQNFCNMKNIGLKKQF